MKYLLNLSLLTCFVFSNKMYQSFSLVKAYYFEMLFAVLIALSFFFIRKIKIPIYLTAMVGCWCLSTCLSVEPWVSFWGGYNRGIGLNGYLWLYLYAVALINLYTKEDYDRTFTLIMGVGVLYALMAGLQYAGYSPLESWSQRYNPAIAFAGNSNMAGNVMALCLPFALQRNKFLSMIIFTGVVLSFSRSAILASLIIVVFWFIKTKKMRLLIVILGIAVFIAGRYLPNNNRLANIFHYEKTIRYSIVKDSLPLMKSFFGVGIEQFRMAHGKIKSETSEALEPRNLYDSPHNIYVNWIASCGWIGGLLYLLCIPLGFCSSDRGNRYAWLGFSIWGFGSFNTFESDVLLWIMIARVFSEVGSYNIYTYIPGVQCLSDTEIHQGGVEI